MWIIALLAEGVAIDLRYDVQTRPERNRYR